MTELGVWWDGVLVASVTERRHRMRCQYTAPDAPMLSVSMPPRSAPYDNRVARPFFHGLLPEGEARRMIAYDLGLGNEGATDIQLLEVLGRDVAGALIITSADRTPPTPHPAAGPELDDEAVAQRLRDLPTQPLGVDGEVRLSLPGMQPKLLLTRDLDRTWRLPADGAPSTHILKPAHPMHADTIGNELFCQRFAATVGVDAAVTDVIDFDGVPALVSTRFDRLVVGDNAVTRIHQEDLCQATSVLTESPQANYQHMPQGRPSFAAAADILDRWGDRGQREGLIGQILVSMLVGNADLHGKNLSFLHLRPEVRLAPAYDIMATTALPGSTTLGMYVADVRDVQSVSPLDVVEEAVRWGLRRASVDAVVTDILDRAPSAAEAAGQDPRASPAVIDHVRNRIDRARTRYGARSEAPRSFPGTAAPERRSHQPASARTRERCGAPTRTGKPCRNPAGSCPHHPMK